MKNKKDINIDFSSVCKLLIPIVLTISSANIMMFADRVVLSYYSIEAMNSVSIASLSCSMFLLIGINIASIAEVYVGQYHGAKQLPKINIIVWQMVWFSVLFGILLILLSLFTENIFIPTKYREDGVPYYNIIIRFGFLPAAITAFSSFFLGQNKPAIVTYIALISNLINIILDPILIFGLGNIIPEFGVKGAAYATVISQLINLMILVYFFQNSLKKNSERSYFRFNRNLFINSMKLGIPIALGHFIEILAWVFLTYIVGNYCGYAEITSLNIGSSIFALCACFSAGLHKGSAIITANLIGADRIKDISKFIKSLIKILFVFIILILIPLIVFPEITQKVFLHDIESANAMDSKIKITFILLFIYIIFDAIVWCFAGILTAGGDTKSVMYINGINSWLCAAIPAYIMIYIFKAVIYSPWFFLAIYSVINSLCFFVRYKQVKYLKLAIN